MYTKLRIGNKCNKRSPITVKHAIMKNAVTYSILFYYYLSVVEILSIKYDVSKYVFHFQLYLSVYIVDRRYGFMERDYVIRE